MTYGEFVNFFGNAFGLFISTLGNWCDLLIHNYFFITILGTILFCSFVLFFKDFFVDLLSSLSYSLKKSSDEYVTNNFLYAEQNNSYILQELNSQSNSNYLQYNNLNFLNNKSRYAIPEPLYSPGMDVPPPDVPYREYYEVNKKHPLMNYNDDFDKDDYASPDLSMLWDMEQDNLSIAEDEFLNNERGYL